MWFNDALLRSLGMLRLKNGLFALLMLLPIAAQAQGGSEAAARVGFTSLKQELSINPCLSDKVVADLYGHAAIPMAEQERKKWPVNLCQNPLTVQALADWHFSSSALLANTERPVVIANLIQQRNRTLLSCKTVACISQQLPRMLEWAKVNLDRTPITNSDSRPLSVIGKPLLHPKISLRGLQLPLEGQRNVCSGDAESLEFYTSNMSVTGAALAVARCVNQGQASLWLLEKDSQTTDWKTILFAAGEDGFSILPNNREAHPTLFLKNRVATGELITVYEFDEDAGYQRKISFVVTPDEFGMLHAFDLTFIQ